MHALFIMSASDGMYKKFQVHYQNIFTHAHNLARALVLVVDSAHVLTFFWLKFSVSLFIACAVVVLMSKIKKKLLFYTNSLSVMNCTTVIIIVFIRPSFGTVIHCT